jgi:hypothetical protein
MFYNNAVSINLSSLQVYLCLDENVLFFVLIMQQCFVGGNMPWAPPCPIDLATTGTGSDLHRAVAH